LIKVRTARAALAAALVSCVALGGLFPHARPARAAAPAATRTLHIAWFEFSPADVLQQLGNQYARERGIQIIVDRPPTPQWYPSVFNQFARHKTSFAAAALDSQWLGEAVADGDVLELNGWLKKNLNVGDFYPSLFAAYSQYPQRLPGQTGSLDLANGHFYGVPWFADAKMFAYRKDLFADPTNKRDFKARYHYDLGVPKSMDQIVDIADFFTGRYKGFYGYAGHEQPGYDAAAETFLGWCWNYGGEIWNPTTSAVQGYINSPRCVHALQFVDHLTQRDSPPGSGNNFIAEVTADMTQGRVAMSDSWLCCNSGYFDPKANTLGRTKAEIESKIGFFNYPGETYMGKTSRVSPLGGMGLSISAYASPDDQAAMLDFAKWFLTPRIQKEWYQFGATPASTSILTSADFKAAQPWNPETSQVFSFTKDFWNMPQYASMLSVMNDTVSASMVGRVSARAALNTIAAAQATILQRSRSANPSP